MTYEMVLVLAILAVAVFFLITEWLPMEVVALLVLSSIAITGLVKPVSALSGFSNPAVITVWAVFILSGGLTRTGVANIIGRLVLRLSGRREASIIAVVMLAGGIMSAFMNNVAVAALLLPVVMDIARQTGNAPSRLMMPLAYGTLLGGLTTKIGTPPNLLVSEFLRENNLESFGLFDFTPVGVIVMLAGIGFMVLIGRHLLPRRNIADEYSNAAQAQHKKEYFLKEQMFSLLVPPGTTIQGKSLAETRLGTLFGLNVVAIKRKDRTILAPSPSEILHQGDALTVEGSSEQVDRLKSFIENWHKLKFEKVDDAHDLNLPKAAQVAEIRLSSNSFLVDKTLRDFGFRSQFEINVLAIKRSSEVMIKNVKDIVLKADDILLIQGAEGALEKVKLDDRFEDYRFCTPDRLIDVYKLHESLMTVTLPEGAIIEGKTLEESRLGLALGIRVLSITRGGTTISTPGPRDKLLSGDILLLKGSAEALSILKNLSELKVDSQKPIDIEELEAEDVGMIEAILHPHSKIAGQSLRKLRFREKYGLNVLSIWRKGQAHRQEFLADMALEVGDAMLLYGPREKFSLLGSEPDFLVLTESVQEIPNYKKAKISILIMLCAVLPAVLNLIPIYISTLIGASLMVITGCLTMTEAHRSVEWKGIILIAGMLPLGAALDGTGTAQYLANLVVSAVGAYGPLAVMGGLMALTFLATCVIPTAALVVLLGPIVLNTAAGMGVSQHAMIMAVAVSASASFMTPISHPANIMVMGPGGYKFSDYLKAGVPLTVMILVLVMVILPIFWPL
jgi:di/tricarboxylate transporter